MAVLVKSSEFLKNRERLIHSHDFRRVNSTAQESLQKWCERKSKYRCNNANLDVLTLTCCLHCQANGL